MGKRTIKLDQTEILNGYYRLNKIKPIFFQQEYPYNRWNAEKVELTYKLLDIKVKSKKVKKGGGSPPVLIFT